MENKVGTIGQHPLDIYLDLLFKHVEIYKHIKNTVSDSMLYGIWKQEKYDHKEFGYYPSGNTQIIHLYNLFIKYKITSFIELGAGIGLIGNVIWHFYPTAHGKCYKDFISYKGYENEKSLITLGKDLFASAKNIEEKNILKLTTEELMYCNLINHHNTTKQVKVKAIYMFDPFSCFNTAIKFNKHLANIMVKGQYLFYNFISIDRANIFLKDDRFKEIEGGNGIIMLKKIK